MPATFFSTPSDFRRWLSEHHDNVDELWVGYYKKATGKPSMTWPESVDEALCYGWIDGLRKSIDGEAYRIRFTPRRPGSHWSRVNLGRVEALIGEERMTPNGLVGYEARDPEKSGRYSFERDEARFSAGQVAAFEDAKAIYNVMQDLMVLFYAFVGVMLVFGAAMAFALIFSAMSVNISERSREIATLLAVGTERRAISRYITGENMLVALLGIPIGLVVGYYMSKAAMATFSSDLFAFDLYVRPSTFLFAALAILGVALLSQWPGLRALRRIDIPRYIKERSA